MQPLTLHFDFAAAPLAGDPDGSRLRYELSRSLDRALSATGCGRWRGGRYARGRVTLFLEVRDRAAALAQVRTILAAKGILDHMTVAPLVTE